MPPGRVTEDAAAAAVVNAMHGEPEGGVEVVQGVGDEVLEDDEVLPFVWVAEEDVAARLDFDGHELSGALREI